MMLKFTRAEVFGAGGYPVASDRFLLDGGTPSHSHDFLEMAVVLGGSATHLTRSQQRALRPGSVIVVRPGQWHGYRDCRAFDVFNLYLGPELVRRELSWLLDFPDLARFILQGGQSATELAALSRSQITNWLREMNSRSPQQPGPSSIILLGLASCALGEIAELAFASGEPTDHIAQSVRGALDAMSDDLSHSWTMTELSRLLSVSVSHLHRQFSSSVGSPPMTWLASVRAERAAVLLIQTDLSMSTIGRQVGWADANYASRRFRQAYGISPSTYRSQFRSL